MKEFYISIRAATCRAHARRQSAAVGLSMGAGLTQVDHLAKIDIFMASHTGIMRCLLTLLDTKNGPFRLLNRHAYFEEHIVCLF